MIDQRKMIDALLLLEAMFMRLGSLVARIFLSIGQGLMSLMPGQNGQRLLSSREIYARNLFKHWRSRANKNNDCGLYIGRVGKHHYTRRLIVGQD